MIIKETPWEKRNLGVNSSIEFYIDNSDRLSDLEPICLSKKEYQVAHVESGNVEALLFLQSQGFNLIEMNIQLARELSNVELPSIYKRFENVISYKIADGNEIDSVLDIVRQGNMFRTDKIALDPFFGEEQSGIRYYYWSREVIESGGIVVMALYKEKPIGFEIYTEKQNHCTNFIGGVFPEYDSKGLGFVPLYVELLSQKSRGNKKVITGISSNNIPVLHLHEILGYRVSTMSYLLIKHL